MAANQSAIEYRGVSKFYGPVQALDRINLQVNQGEIIGFLGPNGAGKSTSIRILFDLIRPEEGHAFVMGHDCQTDGVAARRLLGYLPGEVHLYEGLTGRQTIDLFKGLGLDVHQSYLNRLLDRLGFDPDHTVGSYSKGNRQKLGLLLAMMHRPEVLVLDEPTSGLDPLVQEAVADLLQEQAAAGVSVFFSSHVLSEVERMCHRVAIIRDGRIVAVEEVGALKGRSLHIVEVTFAEPVSAGVFDIEGIRVLQSEGNTVHLEVHNNLDAALKVIARYKVLDLRTEQPSLEQLFHAYYAGEETPEAARATA